jgi:hypothetical protein
MYGCGISVNFQWWVHVSRIEPLRSLVLHGFNKGIMNILDLSPCSELNTGTPQNMWICGIQVWLQLEEVAKKCDGWGNAKESFTKMNKD